MKIKYLTESGTRPLYLPTLQGTIFVQLFGKWTNCRLPPHKEGTVVCGLYDVPLFGEVKPRQGRPTDLHSKTSFPKSSQHPSILHRYSSSLHNRLHPQETLHPVHPGSYESVRRPENRLHRRIRHTQPDAENKYAHDRKLNVIESTRSFAVEHCPVLSNNDDLRLRNNK